MIPAMWREVLVITIVMGDEINIFCLSIVCVQMWWWQARRPSLLSRSLSRMAARFFLRSKIFWACGFTVRDWCLANASLNSVSHVSSCSWRAWYRVWKWQFHDNVYQSKSMLPNQPWDDLEAFPSGSMWKKQCHTTHACKNCLRSSPLSFDRFAGTLIHPHNEQLSLSIKIDKYLGSDRSLSWWRFFWSWHEFKVCCSCACRAFFVDCLFGYEWQGGAVFRICHDLTERVLQYRAWRIDSLATQSAAAQTNIEKSNKNTSRKPWLS